MSEGFLNETPEVMALIRRASKGNDNAFNELVLKYQKLVYNIAFRETKNSEDAFDISQEAFLKAWRAISTFRGESTFAVWIAKITKNCCLDFFRKNSRRPQLATPSGEDDNPFENISDPSLSPELRAEIGEEAQAVLSILSSLPDEQKEAVTLRDIDNLTYSEIAELLQVSEGTVKSRISRGRESIRAEFKKRNLL